MKNSYVSAGIQLAIPRLRQKDVERVAWAVEVKKRADVFISCSGRSISIRGPFARPFAWNPCGVTTPMNKFTGIYGLSTDGI
ncbi:MAG: hypothetical protein PHW87_01290 [Methanothrix sp.]|nr:hypothetical protein [Methanothrix sp.]